MRVLGGNGDILIETLGFGCYWFLLCVYVRYDFILVRLRFLGVLGNVTAVVFKCSVRLI